MKLNLTFLFFIFLLAAPVFAQTENNTGLNDGDKEQIIVEILKQEIRRDEEQDKKKQNIIYILDENLPVKQIPEIKGIDIVLIKQADVEAKKNSEIEYYEFREFRVEAAKVSITVIWNQRDSSSSHSAVIEYKCQKKSGKWKVVGEVVGISVGENA
ncbi:MAG TPA: hypothetical protein VGC76_20185 [Pyrinomonadaceae bacterium]|jgi:hypothetical protein